MMNVKGHLRAEGGRRSAESQSKVQSPMSKVAQTRIPEPSGVIRSESHRIKVNPEGGVGKCRRKNWEQSKAQSSTFKVGEGAEGGDQMPEGEGRGEDVLRAVREGRAAWIPREICADFPGIRAESARICRRKYLISRISAPIRAYPRCFIKKFLPRAGGGSRLFGNDCGFFAVICTNLREKFCLNAKAQRSKGAKEFFLGGVEFLELLGGKKTLATEAQRHRELERCSALRYCTV
jgi:hypothetical protein